MNINREELRQQIYKWIEIAEEDLLIAKHAFELKSNVPYRIIGFHAQQSAEKYLKALLVSRLIDFPYTHSIEFLLKLCPAEYNLQKRLADTHVLTDYAVAKRYPSEFQKLSREEAIESIALAEKVKSVVLELLLKDGFNLKDLMGK